MDIKVYHQMVEQVFSDLGVDPATCRGEQPGQWNLKKGSASVWVDIFKIEGKDYGYFQCMAPICKIPTTNKEAFFHEALETNHKLYGVGFTVYKDGLYIKMIREVEGLEASEILAGLNRIGNYADEYDDYFNNKYIKGSGSAPI
jgi:hypothetical protein